MKAVRKSFGQMMRLVCRDRMLFAACIAPVLAGIVFKFAIPAAETAICVYVNKTAVISPYYGLIDGFLAMLAPVMFCFAAAMVCLEERDDRIVVYYSVTPLGRRGYLLSRLGIPAAAAFALNFILLPLFSLSGWHLWETVYLAAGGAASGVIVALLIVTLSADKLEGMAVTKLSALTIVGIALPCFVEGNIRYILAPLPSFWMGEAMYGHWPGAVGISAALFLVWIFLLLKLYTRKLV